MAAGMKPDVAAEAKAALESAIESGHARFLPGGEVVFTAAGFAAWYAAERRLIREQIAREIEANPERECSGAVAACARIARGGAR